MAYLPCSVGTHFNPRYNAWASVALAQGADSTQWKLRLCPAHWKLVEDYLAEYEVPSEDSAISTLDSGAQCIACGDPADQFCWNLFVTAYPTKNERKDYWAHIHEKCELIEPLRREWGHE